MISAETLKTFAANPAEFRRQLIIPAARGPERFGSCMSIFQQNDFAALDPSFLALRDGKTPPRTRYWLERTKGASKDSDLAVCLLWLLAFSRRPLTCQVGAGDKDQADELRKAAKGILQLNDWLGSAIKILNWTITGTRTESQCDIIAADVAGSHGARPDLLIANELSHVTRKEFMENLFDNASKMPNGVAVVATNAGFIPSWQWDWRENARTSDRWYFSAYSQPAPWLDAANLPKRRSVTAHPATPGCGRACGLRAATRVTPYHPPTSRLL
jgi:hypothetical protein